MCVWLLIHKSYTTEQDPLIWSRGQSVLLLDPLHKTTAFVNDSFVTSIHWLWVHMQYVICATQVCPFFSCGGFCWFLFRGLINRLGIKLKTFRPVLVSILNSSVEKRIEVKSFKRSTSGGVYVPCIYTNASWELPLATPVFVVFVWRLPSAN